MATVKSSKSSKSNKGSESKVNAKVKPFEPNVKILYTVEKKPSELVLTDKFRGRSRPVAEEEVINLAESLRIRQDQPIQIRKDTNEVIFGNTRTAAGLLIEKGYQLQKRKGDGFETVDVAPVPDFTLRCEVVEVDDEEAILRNVTENAHRVATSPVDDALNHELLRTEYGMSDASITKLYGYGHQSSVTQLKKLLMLPESLQKRVHENNMTKNAAFVLVDYCKKKGYVSAETNICDEAKCDELLAKVQGTQEEGGIGANEVQNAIKEVEKEARKLADEAKANAPAEGTEGGTAPEGTTTEGTPTAEGGTATATTTETKYTAPLTLKTVKDTFEEFAGLPDVPSKVAEFCTMTINFIKNEIEKDAYFEYLMAELGNAE